MTISKKFVTDNDTVNVHNAGIQYINTNPFLQMSWFYLHFLQTGMLPSKIGSDKFRFDGLGFDPNLEGSGRC